MGLAGDLKEIKTLWLNSSWSFKAIIIFSTFLAISPIASLSDTIFQWKGFIYDGIEFYRNNITEPLKKLASNALNTTWQQNAIDYLIILFLYFTGFLRKFWLSGKTIENIFITSSLIAGFIYSAILFSGPTNTISLSTFFFITFIYCIIPFLWKENLQLKLAQFLPVAFAIFIVLIF
ncbi:hypothetical protein VU11_02205, partial [Desulfobulbus sp. US2]|nr:hypothetical protein [Desulfobulbus sp. US2]